MNDIDIEKLQGIAQQLRIHSIAATTAAGSGHPTSCCSAADIVAALFFGHMRFLPKDPHYYNNDRFILSKGHAAPLLYAAWAELGFSRRKSCSNSVNWAAIWKDIRHPGCHSWMWRQARSAKV